MTMAKPHGNCLAVVGGQYGSEGKGVIVAHLASRFKVHVRVGGPNAGHSMKYNAETFKMQSLPCGWVNPEATLVLARGGLIHMPTLDREVKTVARMFPRIKERIIIDKFAGILSDWHHEEEGGVQGELHRRIGSTGEGVGAARLARIRRDPSRFQRAFEVAEEWGLGECLSPSALNNIRNMLDRGDHVLLEGTQGSGLSLLHGPWPYVTSADTNAAQMAADVGLSPRLVNRIMLVVRTFPIRVAGNSGPLEGELSWDQMSRRLGKSTEERTTVTKKIRRVGEWDDQLFIDAVRLNVPTSIALTFADYLDPKVEGLRRFDSLTRPVREFVDRLEKISNVPVALVGTGGPSWAVVDRGIAV
jgi:adenylosuccinate synthase